MNYSFLVGILLLLLVSAPIALIGANREGKRRRLARARRGNAFATVRGVRIVQRKATRNWKEFGGLLRELQQDGKLPRNELAHTAHTDSLVKLSEVWSRAAPFAREIPKA